MLRVFVRLTFVVSPFVPLTLLERVRFLPPVAVAAALIAAAKPFAAFAGADTVGAGAGASFEGPMLEVLAVDGGGGDVFPLFSASLSFFTTSPPDDAGAVVAASPVEGAALGTGCCAPPVVGGGAAGGGTIPCGGGNGIGG